ncbi:UBX domain-containing protein 10 isoform 1-T1 [Pelodytes ibericus]
MASVPTGLSVPRSGNPLHRMHVTRPKSAKGRTRTTPQAFSHSVEEYTCHTSPSPRVPTARAPTSPRIAQEDVPELLHQLPARPPSSTLNRYRVLPSIGAAGSKQTAEDLALQTSSMQLSNAKQERYAKTLYQAQPPSAVTGTETSRSQKPQRRQEVPSVPVNAQGIASLPLNLEEPSDQEPRLLLAIRSHSGQRFERYFRPSDTIQTVLAVAEEKTGASCDNCCVETMEVPRRSFPDLHRTLQDCGIPNKSVLCIHQRERD